MCLTIGSLTDPQFGLEASVWYGIKDFNVLARNITVPGFSPRYPQAHCTLNGEICQVTTGEAGTIRNVPRLIRFAYSF